MKINEQKFVNRKFGHKSFADILSAQEKNKRKTCFSSKKDDLETKNKENRERLIVHYSYLVNWVANKFSTQGLKDYEKEDLISYGTIGLIEAIDRFDPSRNTSFESFAIQRIRGAIYDELRASDLLSRGSRKKVKNLSKVVSELENKLGRHPSEDEIAFELQISLNELRFIQQEAHLSVSSLDEVRENSEDSGALLDNLSSNEISVHEEMEEADLLKHLEKAIHCLPEREKTILGMYHFQNLTFKEIAKTMSFSESRASQLHAKAISLLKNKMIGIA